MDLPLPLLPWLLIFGFLWLFVFRRLTARGTPSFLYDSNADAGRAGRRPWWPRVIVIALIVLGFLTVLTLLLANAANAPGGSLVDTVLPLSPWLVIFLIIWVFFFRLLRRQTRHNWE